MDTQPPRDQNPKALLKGKDKKIGGKKTNPAVCMVVFKREKKMSRGKWISTGLFGVASVSLCNRDEMARHLCRHGVEVQKKTKKHVCVLFQCEAGRCTEGFYHVCLVKPL